MPYLVWTAHRLLYREAGDPAQPLLVLLPGSTASSVDHSAELKHFGRRFHVAARYAVMGSVGGGGVALLTALQIPDRRRWLSNGGRHPAIRTCAPGFSRAADCFLAAAHF